MQISTSFFHMRANSCYRNHRRHTLCGGHFTEAHQGKWQDCPKCREAVPTEMYVYYGTNEYNFETLPNPPAFEPTRCSKCNKVIKLSEGGYSVVGGEHRCMDCIDPKLKAFMSMRRS